MTLCMYFFVDAYREINMRGEGGKVREYEGSEGEREEDGAEGDGRRGVGKGDGEEVLYAITCTYTLLFQSNTPKPRTLNYYMHRVT